jgi:hypothetical protein
LIERNQFVSVARRLVVIAALIALVLLTTHSVVHWHGSGHREDHCQICHAGHATAPRPVCQLAARAPILVARFATGDASAPRLEFFATPSIPRAPPA